MPAVAGSVDFPHRLEDPAPQPPYLLLVPPPVDGIPPSSGQRRQKALRSVRHRRPTCPLVPAPHGASPSTAHLPTSARFRVRAGVRPVSGQFCGNSQRRSWSGCSRLLSPFGHRRWLLGHPVLAKEVQLPLRSAYHPKSHGVDLDEVPMFRTCETRLGEGVLWTPGTAVSPRPSALLSRRLPPCSGWSLSLRHCFPTRNVRLTRHQQGFIVIHPSSLPLACGPRTEQGPSGFTPGLRTPPARTRGARQGRDRSRH